MNEQLKKPNTEESETESQANHQDSMRQTILRSISAGDVNRKPKWKFVVQSVFVTIGIVLVLLAAVYLASAVFFALRVNGVWFLPSLGFAGILPFLHSLPWVFLILSVIFVILLYMLVKRYSFAYGRPLLYSALAVVVVVIASSVLIGLTSFHQGIFQRAHDGRLPFPGSPIYQNFGLAPHSVTIGVINKMTPTEWTITSHDGIVYTIDINPNIPLPSNPMVGDEVVVLGQRDDEDIENRSIDALAIRPLKHGGQLQVAPPPDQNTNQVPNPINPITQTPLQY